MADMMVNAEVMVIGSPDDIQAFKDRMIIPDGDNSTGWLDFEAVIPAPLIKNKKFDAAEIAILDAKRKNVPFFRDHHIAVGTISVETGLKAKTGGRGHWSWWPKNDIERHTIFSVP